MQVTEVRIKKVGVDVGGKVLAYASVTLDSQLVIHNIRVINGDYKDVVHPIDTSFRTYLEEQILSQYQSAAD